MILANSTNSHILRSFVGSRESCNRRKASIDDVIACSLVGPMESCIRRKASIGDWIAYSPVGPMESCNCCTTIPMLVPANASFLCPIHSYMLSLLVSARRSRAAANRWSHVSFHLRNRRRCTLLYSWSRKFCNTTWLIAGVFFRPGSLMWKAVQQ